MDEPRNPYQDSIPWRELKAYLERKRLEVVKQAEDAPDQETRNASLAQSKLLRSLLNLPETLMMLKGDT